MNYIYDYISEERKKEIAYMNIVDTYNRTGYLDIPGDKVVKSKDEYFLFWYNSPDTLWLRQQIEETGSSSICLLYTSRDQIKYLHYLFIHCL